MKKLSWPHPQHQYKISNHFTSHRPKVKDIQIKEVCTFPHDEDVPNTAEENVQFITNLKFQSDNLCENVDDGSLEDKTNVKDYKIINLSKISKEESI